MTTEETSKTDDDRRQARSADANVVDSSEREDDEAQDDSKRTVVGPDGNTREEQAQPEDDADRETAPPMRTNAPDDHAEQQRAHHQAHAGQSDEASEDDDGNDGQAQGAEQQQQDQQQQEQQSDDESDEEPEPVDDLPAAGAEWLDGLFERMKLDVQVADVTEGEELHFNLGGPDADRLLGVGKLAPKAIEGVETVLGTVYSRHPDSSKIYVDVDEARRQRKEQLQRVGVELADKAVDLDKTVTISGLNSTERRIIHRRLRSYDGVETESVGQGIFRRLQIEPQ